MAEHARWQREANDMEASSSEYERRLLALKGISIYVPRASPTLCTAFKSVKESSECCMAEGLYDVFPGQATVANDTVALDVFVLDSERDASTFISRCCVALLQ